MKRILLVDDQPENLRLLKQILDAEGYQLIFARSGREALQRTALERPDLVLLDVMMPDMDGYEVCRQLKADPGMARVPVIFVTALHETADETRGFEVGGVDFISKPISRPVLLARVRSQLSLVRAEELEETRLLLVQRLGRAAEYKDNETGFHVIRMSHYARILGLAAGMDEEQATLLLHAAPMHDVGKIGTPDRILLKPDKLDADEWAIMQQHPVIGADIIGDHPAPLIQMAREIALTHHEKWDGSGYPQGLAGERIPLVGRIVAIADVFDALTSERPYKSAWPVQEAATYMRKQAGLHFDPRLISLFLEPDTFAEILAVKQRWGAAATD